MGIMEVFKNHYVGRRIAEIKTEGFKDGFAIGYANAFSRFTDAEYARSFAEGRAIGTATTNRILHEWILILEEADAEGWDPCQPSD